MVFATIDINEGRQAYSGVEKLRILNRNINDYCLESYKNNIELELEKLPMILTYVKVISTYSNTVNRKFQADYTQRTPQRIN